QQRLWCVAHGVGGQVVDHLLDAYLVYLHPDVVFEMRAKHDFPRLQLWAHTLQGVSNNGSQIFSLESQTQRSNLNTRTVEHIVDESDESRCSMIYNLKELGDLERG